MRESYEMEGTASTDQISYPRTSPPPAGQSSTSLARLVLATTLRHGSSRGRSTGTSLRCVAERACRSRLCFGREIDSLCLSDSRSSKQIIFLRSPGSRP